MLLADAEPDVIDDDLDLDDDDDDGEREDDDVDKSSEDLAEVLFISSSFLALLRP